MRAGGGIAGPIQADQDAIIRAGSRGALVVDGGPGTGKTVVALHRAAYLVYSDPRLGAGRGGVLFVGPGPAYLSYVEDVLPSLGEESVQTCDVPPHQLRRALARHDELTRTFAKAWPLVEASVLVSDLWSVPAYLRRCAPWLTDDEVHALQRQDASAWTVADLPLLDAARTRLGDPEASRHRRRREAKLASERAYMAQIVERLKEAGDEMMQWLDGEDLRNSLVDEWLAAHHEGTAAVIGDPTFEPSERVRSLTPESAKGLEFDLVVLVEPELLGEGIEGAVDRYVAMTRATERLVILHATR